MPLCGDGFPVIFYLLQIDSGAEKDNYNFIMYS